MGYTLYIDESGEEGVQNIRTTTTSGASPWLVFGACLIEDAEHENAKRIITNIEQKLNITHGLHFKNLKHRQKIFALKELSKINAVFFGTMSNKISAQKSQYIEYIESESWKYYNKNVQYLLELIARYFEQNHIGFNDHKIIFERKRGVQYEKMKNLIRSIHRNPLRQHMACIKHINPDTISSEEKEDEELFKISDAIANSLFHCCENKKLGITETRYLNEIRQKFAHNDQGRILEHGIKAINSLSDLGIYPEDSEFLNKLKVDTE